MFPRKSDFSRAIYHLSQAIIAQSPSVCYSVTRFLASGFMLPSQPYSFRPIRARDNYFVYAKLPTVYTFLHYETIVKLLLFSLTVCEKSGCRIHDLVVSILLVNALSFDEVSNYCSRGVIYNVVSTSRCVLLLAETGLVVLRCFKCAKTRCLKTLSLRCWTTSQTCYKKTSI